MSGKEELSNELKAFEAELATLTPRPGGLDVRRLMYLAGQTSARRSARAWSAAFAAMTAVAATLAVALLLQPGPKTIEKIVRIPIEPDVRTASAEADTPPAVRHASIYRVRRTETTWLASLAPWFGMTPNYERPAEPTYPELRDRVLAFGASTLCPTGQSVEEPSKKRPATYGDWMRILGEERS
ncbi:MAG: hypothetical protein JW818_18530 [Pirellulales bacterium]|nr:hypothetical protein [Pirellulales bacterium]